MGLFAIPHRRTRNFPAAVVVAQLWATHAVSLQQLLGTAAA